MSESASEGQSAGKSPQSWRPSRRHFVGTLAGAAAFPYISCSRGPRRSTTEKKVIVLGIDGLDPKMVKALIDTGRAPNFKKLAKMGVFAPLGDNHARPQPGGLVQLHHRPQSRGARHRRLHRPRPGRPTCRSSRSGKPNPSGRTLSTSATTSCRSGAEKCRNRRHGHPVLVIPHRPGHPGVGHQDPDQLPGRRNRHPRRSAAWAPPT